MYWVGKTNDRISRSNCNPPMCESRWIVPVKPYQAPKGSQEQAESMILLGVGIAAVIFSFALLIASAM